MKEIVKSQPTKVEVLPSTPTSLKSIEDDTSQILRSKLTEKVKEHWDALTDAQIQLAVGMYLKEYVKDPKTGKVKLDASGMPVKEKVYRTKPDKDIIKYLIDQQIGKPKENVIVESKVHLVMDL